MYDRKVSRFFSRASRDGPKDAEVAEAGELGRESVLGLLFVPGRFCREANEAEVGVALAGAPDDVTVLRSLAGGGRTISSGCALRSCGGFN